MAQSGGSAGVIGSQAIYGETGSTGARSSRDPAHHVSVELTPDAWDAVKRGREVIDAVLERKEVAYGINTGTRKQREHIRSCDVLLLTAELICSFFPFPPSSPFPFSLSLSLSLSLSFIYLLFVVFRFRQFRQRDYRSSRVVLLAIEPDSFPRGRGWYAIVSSENTHASRIENQCACERTFRN